MLEGSGDYVRSLELLQSRWTRIEGHLEIHQVSPVELLGHEAVGERELGINLRVYKIVKDIIDKMCKYMSCKSDDVCHKIACVVVDNEVLGRIMEKSKVLLKIPHVMNLREVDRLFD